MKIQPQEFEAYEEVRESGLTNMFNVTMVSELSGLEKDKVLAIMKGYNELKETYRKWI